MLISINQTIYWNQLNRFQKVFYASLILFCLSIITSLFIFQVACTIVILSWFYRLIYDKNYKFKKTPFDIPITIFVLFRTLSVITSVNHDASLAFIWKEFPFYLLYFAFTQNIDLKNRNSIKIIIFTLVLSGLVGSFYGIYLFALNDYARAQSTTAGYMTLSLFLSSLIVLLLPIGRDIFKSNIIFWSVLGVLFLALLLTLSRVHIVLTVIFIIIIMLIKYRRLLWFAPALFILVYGFSADFRDRIQTIFDLKHNLSDRDVLVMDAFEKITQKPLLGYGPLTFLDVFTSFDKLQDKKVHDWHNGFIQVYIESGVFALLSFLWLTIYSSALAIKMAIRMKNTELGNLALGCSALLLIFYISSFSGGSIFGTINGQFYKLGLAITALISHYREIE